MFIEAIYKALLTRNSLISFKYIGYLRQVPTNLMRVLGIDPGSETLGWGIVDGSAAKYASVDFGVVKSSPRDAFSKRLANIYQGVAKVIDQFEPDVLSIEEAFYAANVSVALKLGQVRGVVLLLAEQRGLKIAEYAPRLIKQTVVGYGNADKRQVQEMVKLLLKMRSVPTPHDAADALAIAICHVHHAGMRDKIEKSLKKSR
jgi:crossover junction endodeoxyribonuclease RuvC